MKNEQLATLFEPVVTSLGCELWGCEMLSQGRHNVLRVYLEKQPGGVTSSDCSEVSRQLSALLDVEDPIRGRYRLEVSSPGMGRPLFTLAHYETVVNEQIKLKLRMPLNGQRQFKGKLLAVSSAEISLEVEGEMFAIEFSNIDKANLIPNFEGLL